MLNHPIFDQLLELKLTGMHRALTEQMHMDNLQTLSFEERLGLLIDREATERTDKRLLYRLRNARLRQNACIEDIDYRHRRGLDKRLILKLITGEYLNTHLNILITGPVGVGKTWLACALAHKACRDGFHARYTRLPRLLQELPIAKADGRYPKLLRECARPDLLILDDWGLVNLNDESRRDLLDILDDRHNRKSTLITSQLPIDKWHDYIGEPTLADAILGRLVHNAHKINLKGESMRKKIDYLTTNTDKE